MMQKFGEDGYTPAQPYSVVLEEWTSSDRAYDGIVEIFQVTATLHSRDLVEGQTYQDAELFHWTPVQYKEERQKALAESQKETVVFISFYTEKDDQNNLDKKNSIWNIFLDNNGKRVLPSTIKRVYDVSAVLKARYPYHNNWFRPYLVKFPIATDVVTAGRTTLTIAGPVGRVHLPYKSLR
jgi:hypothetical protein